MHQNSAATAPDADELAADVALFDTVESGGANYLYRCWQATSPIVVTGRYRAPADDVILATCHADRIPVVGRTSGGGTVVLGAGCLNYAVALSVVSLPEHIDVAASFSRILGAIAGALDVPGLMVSGGTDLSLHGRKVSGNAQRRGRRAVLHHGTLLFDFDAELAVRYLREPRRQPAYRAGRPHKAFLGNLPLAVEHLQARLELALLRLAPAGVDEHVLAAPVRSVG
jgi:lipoate-protein ligase A